MLLGLTVAVCAFSALAGTALGANKHKAHMTFGKFRADYPFGASISPTSPASATGLGEMSELHVAGGGLLIHDCKKVNATATVTAEKSENFVANTVFKHCIGRVSDNGNGFVKNEKVGNFGIRMEFHSNHSAKFGAVEEGEVVIKPTHVYIALGGRKNACEIVLPEQVVEKKSASKPEKTYESAEYETEKYPESLKKFPKGFQEKLDIEWEFEKLISWEKPTAACNYVSGGTGTRDTTPGTPAYGYVVFEKGTFEGEIEEFTIKHGNLGFETKAEVEAE
ncbi:MAG: hypothetical protein ACRDJX_07730 [Solirubrobacteraceae bacterium]